MGSLRNFVCWLADTFRGVGLHLPATTRRAFYARRRLRKRDLLRQLRRAAG